MIFLAIKTSIQFGDFPAMFDETRPICSMYRIFTYMWDTYGINVVKHSSTMELMGEGTGHCRSLGFRFSMRSGML